MTKINSFIVIRSDFKYITCAFRHETELRVFEHETRLLLPHQFQVGAALEIAKSVPLTRCNPDLAQPVPPLPPCGTLLSPRSNQMAQSYQRRAPAENICMNIAQQQPQTLTLIELQSAQSLTKIASEAFGVPNTQIMLPKHQTF